MIDEKYPDGRLRYYPDKRLDEVVMLNTSVHLEDLSGRAFMLIVENEHRHWHLRISSKTEIKVWMYEEFLK